MYIFKTLKIIEGKMLNWQALHNWHVESCLPKKIDAGPNQVKGPQLQTKGTDMVEGRIDPYTFPRSHKKEARRRGKK